MRNTVAIAAIALVAMGVALALSLRPPASAGGTSEAAEAGVPRGSDTIDLTNAKEHEVEVEIERLAFRPSVITGVPEHQAILGVGNDSQQKHTFTIDGVVDEVILPGEEREILVVLPPEGEVTTFYCRFHEDFGMSGVLGDPGAVP